MPGKMILKQWPKNIRPANRFILLIPPFLFLSSTETDASGYIYPKGIPKRKKRYPVLYMHDGQNLFDAATSAYGEWGVDECLDSLIRVGKAGLALLLGLIMGRNG